MIKEKAYDFRKRMLEVHKPNIRNFSKKCENGFLELSDGLTIHIEAAAGDVIKTAACDFIDFLDVSMNIEASISRKNMKIKKGDITIQLAENAGVDLGAAKGYKGFLIKTDDKIEIFAHDERGAAQALYYLEDLMTFERAPFIKHGEARHKAAFSPQMVHSGYGFDEYPDEYLAAIAHEGRDAILVYTMDVNLTPSGHLTFNELIERAAKYGIDVYAYSYLLSEVSPEAENAESYYEDNYGRLFKECPKLKGVTLVGEAVEFPSRDPHVSSGRYYELTDDGILHGKPSSGMYPCEDYPVWLNLLKRIIRKYNPEADIVFWSYNWGSQPEEARVKLIENLPEDITLQATFEMFEPRKFGDAISHCADYTLSFEGPGRYFASEAIAAKKRGIKLYSMTNTGGLTWDFGVIPYEPMPQQWNKRYEAMHKAKEDWGLCGLMEAHHYGFYPSFISKLSKWAFFEPRVSLTEITEKIVKSEFGEENFSYADKALKLLSEAIRHYTPSDADQYCAFRVGPSYPFCLYQKTSIPSSREAKIRPNPMFGSGICVTEYGMGPDARDSIASIRIPEEIKSLEKTYEIMAESVKELEKAPDTNENLLRLLNMTRFMMCCLKTGINTKRWFVLKNKFFAESSKEILSKLLDDMENLLKNEMVNAKEAIPYVEADSRLGWEPRMLYVTDKEHIEWKIKQVQAVIDCEISVYRKSLTL